MTAMQLDRKMLEQAGRVSGLGLTAGLTMLACGAAGLWLDRHLGTMPWLTIILFLAGGFGALWYGMVAFLK